MTSPEVRKNVHPFILPHILADIRAKSRYEASIAARHGIFTKTLRLQQPIPEVRVLPTTGPTHAVAVLLSCSHDSQGTTWVKSEHDNTHSPQMFYRTSTTLYRRLPTFRSTLTTPSRRNMTSHPLLNAFRESKPAFGAWITIPSPWVARTAAQASPHLSWLVVDCEHGLIPLQPGAADTIAAVSGIGTTTPSLLVRIPATGACAETSCAWQIKYVLDAGARGVIVPMVRPGDPRCGLRTHIVPSYFTRLIVHSGIDAPAGTLYRVCS